MKDSDETVFLQLECKPDFFLSLICPVNFKLKSVALLACMCLWWWLGANLNVFVPSGPRH